MCTGLCVRGACEYMQMEARGQPWVSFQEPMSVSFERKSHWHKTHQLVLDWLASWALTSPCWICKLVPIFLFVFIYLFLLWVLGFKLKPYIYIYIFFFYFLGKYFLDWGIIFIIFSFFFLNKNLEGRAEFHSVAQAVFEFLILLSLSSNY